MKIFYFLILLSLISIIDCHISIVANLIKDEKYKLKGTFTINSAIIANSYLCVKDNLILFSKKKQKFDIIEITNHSYFLISRYYKSFIGIDKKNNNKLSLYRNLNIINESYITWDFIEHKSKLTKSNIVFTIRNNFSKKYLFCSKEMSLKLESLPVNSSFTNFQFRVLKIFSEEENIKKSNYEKVEKEPIDLFMKYIDLSDKDLKREGIKQIYKDYDAEELRYSLRSILQYIPWVRKIFIVMPNEKVKFLKPYEEIRDKFVYVNDKDFIGYDSANIFSFSFHLHKMEKYNISKNFIYMEDDYFIGKPLNKTDFFYYDEKEQKVLPFVLTNFFSELKVLNRLNFYEYLYQHKEKIKIHGHRGWAFSVASTDKFFIEKYDNRTNIINAEFTHCAVAENIDDLKEIFKEIQDYKYINETLYSKTRPLMTLNQPHFVNMYQLNIKHRKVNIIPSLYINMEDSKMYMLKYPLFVLNTCGDNIPTQKDYKHLSNIMQKRFPNPTKYEIVVKEEKIDNITIKNKTEADNKENDITENKKEIIKNKNDTNNKDNKNQDNSNTIKNTQKVENIIQKDINTKNNIHQNDSKNKNEEINNVINQSEKKNDNMDSIEVNYSFHGYILSGILFSLVIFIKVKNLFEYEY